MLLSIDPRDIYPYIEDYVYNIGIKEIMPYLKKTIGSTINFRAFRSAYNFGVDESVLEGLRDAFRFRYVDKIFQEYVDNEFPEIYENALEYYGNDKLWNMCDNKYQRELVDRTYGLPYNEIYEYCPDLRPDYVDNIAHEIAELIIRYERFNSELERNCEEYFADMMFDDAIKECEYFLKEYRH